MSELDFAAEILPKDIKILAVTGTNGKSTVVTFAGQVFIIISLSLSLCLCFCLSLSFYECMYVCMSACMYMYLDFTHYNCFVKCFLLSAIAKEIRSHLLLRGAVPLWSPSGISICTPAGSRH